MEKKEPSPRILELRWGRLRVEGRERPYKDAKLFPGGSREWDWRETGTEHSPGIQPADVEELLAHGARVVVLSQGMHERLAVMRETLEVLAARGIAAHVLQTEKAVELYNELVDRRRVGGLFHTTC